MVFEINIIFKKNHMRKTNECVKNQKTPKENKRTQAHSVMIYKEIVNM